MIESRVSYSAILFWLFSAVSAIGQTGQFECPPGTEFKQSESSIKKGGVSIGTEEWCERKDANGNPIKHGKWLSRYANSQKMAETEYKDGLMNGMATQWFPTGQKSSEGFIKNGKREGKWTAWHLNGRVASEEEYMDDKLRRTTSWSEDGRMFLHPFEYPDPNDKVAKLKRRANAFWDSLSWNFVTVVVCFLLAVVYWRIFRRVNKSGNTHKMGVRTGIFGSTIAVLAVIYTTVQSGGGHHGLGLFFLPILIPIAGVIGFGVGWALSIPIMFYVERKISGTVDEAHSIGIGRVILALCIISIVGAGSFKMFYPPHLDQKAKKATSSAEIKNIYNNWWIKLSPQTRWSEIIFGSIAYNKNTPVEILRDLAQNHAVDDVTTSLATNLNTPPDVLTQLSKNKSLLTMERIASNPNTPPDVLVELSRDLSWDVVERVANNPNTPSEIATESLIRLSQSADYPLNARAKKKLREQGINPRNKPAE